MSPNLLSSTSKYHEILPKSSLELLWKYMFSNDSKCFETYFNVRRNITKYSQTVFWWYFGSTCFSMIIDISKYFVTVGSDTSAYVDICRNGTRNVWWNLLKLANLKFQHGYLHPSFPSLSYYSRIEKNISIFASILNPATPWHICSRGPSLIGPNKLLYCLYVGRSQGQQTPSKRFVEESFKILMNNIRYLPLWKA